jgi:branched-chain amino acid aminotransferase
MTYQKQVWMNGKMEPWEKANVHILSHGFSRGSAIFEFLGIHKTTRGSFAFRLDDHITRLFKSAELLEMNISQSAAEIKKGVIEAVRSNGIEAGWVKIMAYYSEEALASLVLQSDLDLSIFAGPAEALGLPPADQPVKAGISKWRKLDPQTVPVEAKVAGNYVNGMIVRQDVQKRGFHIGIMLDTEGFVAEGGTESVFMIKDNQIITSPLGRILSGITRMSILEVARTNGFDVQEKRFTQEDLLNADEAFISGSPLKVLSLSCAENKIFDKAPGPITTKLAKLMSEICLGNDQRFQKWLVPMT